MADVTGPSKGAAGAGAPPPPDPAVLAEIDKYVAQLAKDPKSRAFAPLADAYRKVGLLDEAIDVCQEGLKHHAAWTGGRVALGRAYFDKGSKKEAREELEKVVKVTPDNPLAQRLLGILYTEAGETDKAITAFKAVLIFSPDDAEARDRLAALDPSAVAPARPAPVARTPSPVKPAAAAPAPARPQAGAPPGPARAETSAKPGSGAPHRSPDLGAPADEPVSLEGDPAAAVETGVDLGLAGLGGAREIDFGTEQGAASVDAPAAAAAAELMAELTGQADVSDPDLPAGDDPFATDGLDFGSDPIALDEPGSAPVEEPAEAPMAEAAAPPIVQAAPPRPGGPVSAVEGPPLLPLGGEKPPEKPKTEITTNTIAELYIKQGFYQKALDIYRSMRDADPENADITLRLQQVEQEFAARRKDGSAPARAVTTGARPAAPGSSAKPAPVAQAPKPAPHGPARPVAVPPARPVAPPPARPAAVPPARPVAVPPVRPAAVPPARPVAVPPARPAAVPPARPAAVPPARPAATPPLPARAEPGGPPGSAGATPSSRAGRNIQTLEAWLQNIKRR